MSSARERLIELLRDPSVLDKMDIFWPHDVNQIVEACAAVADEFDYTGPVIAEAIRACLAAAEEKRDAER